MFLHVSVILSTGGSASVHAGIPPPSQADIPREQTPSGADTTPEAVHARRYGQRAGGMYPTGMQSCFETKVKGDLMVHLDRHKQKIRKPNKVSH